MTIANDTTMAPTPTPAANKRTKVPSQHELLETCVGIVTKHANEHLMAVSNRIIAALLDVSDPSIDARAVYQRIKSGNLLKSNTYAFFHVAATGIELALRKEVALLAPPPKAARSPMNGALTLVPFEEMDSRVAFGGLSRPFEVDYAEQLATLNVRLGFLLERDILRLGQNPFRPELFLMALNQAWCEFEPDLEAHALLLPLLRPDILFDFAPMFEDLNQALMRKGAQPGSVDAYRIRKTDNAAAAKAAQASSQAALQQQLRQFFGGGAPASAMPVSEFDADIPLIPDLPAMPAGAGGWRPSGAQAFSGDAFSAAPVAALAVGVPVAAGVFQPAMQPVTQQMAQQGRQAGGFVHGATPGGGAPVPYGGFIQAAAQGHGTVQAGGFVQAGPGAGAVGQGAPAGQPGVQLLDFLAQLQQRLPEAFAAGPGAAGVSGGGMKAMMDGVPEPGGAGPAIPHNVFYLPRLKESMPKGSLSRGDESTIDLLSRIFETVHLDSNIPQETRDLIQFLQIPVLKAALLDKNFFFEDAHPARRMIDLMSRMGWEQRQGADDPLFQAMRRSVDRVGRDFTQEVDVFAEAVSELEASLQAEESAAAAAISEPIAQALKQEKVTAATRSAKNAVAMRVGTGAVVAVVETFLANKWTSVLTLAYSIEDEKPGAVGNATKTMDDLIWSVKPKITQQQRKELISKLPSLLATLNKWLDIIKWQDADRLQFFAELAECHASIVRAPLDLSPERQLEIAVEVAQQDAVRRIEKENALAAQAEAEAAEVEDEAVITVDTLERGMWLEFTQPDASVRKVKLAWISPLRTLYIFSTGARQEAFSLSAEKLAEAYRAQQVRVVRIDSVVGRALSEAMEQAAVNDPAMQLPGAAVA